MNRKRETLVFSQGGSFSSPVINDRIETEARCAAFSDAPNQDQENFNQTPPMITDDMFPEGIFQDSVNHCCQNSEAVRAAVGINLLGRLTAEVGPMVYYQIGDEKRLINNYYLLIGPSGMGKGSSEYGPSRIFQRVNDFLELKFNYAREAGKTEGIKAFPFLDVHEGGLSSGEGLAAAKDDGDPKKPESHPVTDKRFLILESEAGSMLTMSQRQGNTLSHILRNGYDGKTIRPLTKRDRVCVSHPFFVLIGNITPGELLNHDLVSSMSVNGMLNRMLMIWTHIEQRQPIPKSMPQPIVDQLAERFADIILFARNGSFETHWKKQAAMARPIRMDQKAEGLWIQQYPYLVNAPDCDLVRSLCRRHRLHCLILASLFALMNCRLEIQKPDLQSALAWIRYSRQSVVYSYRSFSAQMDSQSIHDLSMELLTVISHLQSQKGCCTCSDLYQKFSNRINRDRLHSALEQLLIHIPPLIHHEKIVKGRGRPTQKITLTNEGLIQLDLNTTGGSL